MLTKLLCRKTCAQCRLCCVFDSYDFRETPVFDRRMRDRIASLLPDAAVVSAGTDSFRFRLTVTDDEGGCACPLLDPENGCMLGEDKPFVCRLFPFRVMHLNGRRVIAVSPLCDALTEKPLAVLLRFVRDELADPVFAYAAAHPDEVQPYDALCPVLLWEPQTFD
ncbi:MAG: YkgJ family cysteine cluster protein [Oscillospiraceae bacterium]|nr:YkgJ family cysteine cluster protein [Oscillospiraceae bacterium]